MALERVFQKLVSQLGKLGDALKDVRLTVVEDRPLKDEVVVVDHFEYAVEDVLGWVEEAGKYGTDALQALPHNILRAVQILTRCQQLFQRVQHRYSVDLISYARLNELLKLGSERRGEWAGWTESVANGLEQCRKPMEELGLALTACWLEVAERTGSTNVTVQTTSIGQQIRPAPEEAVVESAP